MQNLGQNQNIFKALKKQWSLIVFITLLVLLLTTVLTIVQPFEYRSSVQFLVLPNYDNENFAAGQGPQKTSQYYSDVLSRVIYTSSFFDHVSATNSGIKNQFSASEEDRKKEWKKAVKTKVIGDTGIIAVDVYAKSKADAGKIASSIAYVLSQKSQIYHGLEGGLDVKIIDGPYTSDNIKRPNIYINLAVGFILGLTISIIAVYFFPGFKLFMNAENGKINKSQRQIKFEKNKKEKKTKETGQNNTNDLDIKTIQDHFNQSHKGYEILNE